MATSIRNPVGQASAEKVRQVQANAGRKPLGMPVIVLALVMAIAGIYAGKVFDFPALYLAAVPVLLCAFARPQFFLILAVAFIPYTFSLANGVGGPSAASTGTTAAAPTSGGGLGAEFGLSDILLLMALPGLLAKAISHPARIRLGNLTLPITLYLIAGLVSYAVNLPFMHGAWLSYFVAFVRSMQIILIIPIGFLSIAWTPEELRSMMRAYLYGAFVMGVFGIIAFAAGQRNGLYILGNHKNGVGLALSFAVLICAAALTQNLTPQKSSPAIEPELLQINRQFLIACTVVCSLGLLCSLSRGSVLCTLVGLLFLSIVRKRGRIFGVVLAVASVGSVGLIYLLPEKQVDYVSNYSVKDKNNYTRIDQSIAAWKRFEENPLVGDGYRTRKDILPHNLEATLLGETGILGILTFFWMIYAQMRLYARARKLLAGDPLREFISMAFSACAIAILVHAQFDPYWRRGPLWMPWIGVGVVAAMVVQEVQARRRLRVIAQAEEDREWRLKRLERAARQEARRTDEKNAALAGNNSERAAV